MDPVEPQLILKTTPPRVKTSAPNRARLALDTPRLADKMVIAVQAPAGFGKTFLLTQWRRECLSQGAVVAWLSLDGQDDGSRFVQGLGLAMAIGSGRQSFVQVLERVREPRRDQFEGLTQWLAQVAELASETVLILDETDSLPAPTIRHLLTYLLYNAPANLRIIMASRVRLNLQVSDLSARGRYATVGTADLRLGIDESLSILSGHFGVKIDADQAARLHEVTEGWPLGLQLAISTLEKAPSPGAAIAALATSTGDIQHYFVENLVAQLSAEQVDFLTGIALLERVQPSLCAALTEHPRAEALLAELCQSTPIFVESIDSDWVRIHPLAREFLLGRFATLAESQRQGYHRRAALWLQQHEFLEQAARQFLLAGLPGPAYEVIEECVYDVALRGRFSRVLEWIEELGTEAVLDRPRICLGAAWALAMGERQAQAAQMIRAIEQRHASDQATLCEAAAISSAAAYFADRIDDSLALVSPWAERLPGFPVKVQAMLANQFARLALSQGQPEKARRIFQRAPHYSWTTGMDAIRGIGAWLMGFSFLWEGRMRCAEDTLRDSLLVAEQDIGRRSPIAVMMACTQAMVLLERGEVLQASTVLANRMDMVERHASPDTIVQGYIAAARLAAIQGQRGRCQDLLEALFALGEERDMPRLCMASLAEQIRLHALQGRNDTCKALWRRLEAVTPLCAREQSGLLGPELALIAGVAEAYVLLLGRDWPAMLAVLERSAVIAQQLRRGRDLVQIKLLTALALRAGAEDGEACLLEAVSLAQEHGMQRIVQDTHPELPKWLHSLQREAQEIEPLAPGPAAVSRVEPSASSVSPSRLLTPKEREVLQLLARNLSNKQIAMALAVGEETVKWHLKNLFGKFQAGTRQHVVARAYMLGILENAN